jgi:hypothetical protein
MRRWRPASQRLIISHFYDLVALALGANGDARALAADKTLGAVRLAAIKADIVANPMTGICAQRRSRPAIA